MKPETYSSKTSWAAFIFYLLLLAAWFAALWWGGEPMWYLALFPFYGFGLILLIKTEKYNLRENGLSVKNLFEHKHIRYEDIHEIEARKHPIWKRILTGFPRQSLKVRFQKSEDVWLHPRKEKFQRDLQEKLKAMGKEL